jgi:hypothetical protein
MAAPHPPSGPPIRVPSARAGFKASIYGPTISPMKGEYHNSVAFFSTLFSTVASFHAQGGRVQPSTSISHHPCSLQSFSHTQNTHAQRKNAAQLCSSTSLGCRVWAEWICPTIFEQAFFCARCSLDSGAPTHKAGTHTHTRTHTLQVNH